MQRLIDFIPTAESEELAAREFYRLAIAASHASSRREYNEMISALKQLRAEGHVVDRDICKNPVTKQLMDAGEENAAMVLVHHLGASIRHIAYYYGKQQRLNDFINLFKYYPDYSYINSYNIREFISGITESLLLMDNPDINNLATIMAKLPMRFNEAIELLAIKFLELNKPDLYNDLLQNYGEEDIKISLTLIICAHITSGQIDKAEALLSDESNQHIIDIDAIILHFIAKNKYGHGRKYLHLCENTLHLTADAAFWGDSDVVEDLVKHYHGDYVNAAFGYAISGYAEKFVAACQHLTNQAQYDRIYLFLADCGITTFANLIADKTSRPDIDFDTNIINAADNIRTLQRHYCLTVDKELCKKFYESRLKYEHLQNAREMKRLISVRHLSFSEAYTVVVEKEYPLKGKLLTQVRRNGLSQPVSVAKLKKPEIRQWIRSAADWYAAGQVCTDVVNKVTSFSAGLPFDDGDTLRKQLWPKAQKYKLFQPSNQQNTAPPVHQPGQKRSKSESGQRKRRR